MQFHEKKIDFTSFFAWTFFKFSGPALCYNNSSFSVIFWGWQLLTQLELLYYFWERPPWLLLQVLLWFIFSSNDMPSLILYFNFYSSDWDSNNANSRGHGETSVGTNNFGGYFCLHDCWLFYWSLWGKLIFFHFFWQNM